MVEIPPSFSARKSVRGEIGAGEIGELLQQAGEVSAAAASCAARCSSTIERAEVCLQNM